MKKEDILATVMYILRLRFISHVAKAKWIPHDVAQALARFLDVFLYSIASAGVAYALGGPEWVGLLIGAIFTAWQKYQQEGEKNQNIEGGKPEEVEI